MQTCLIHSQCGLLEGEAMFHSPRAPDAPGINYEPIKGAKGKDFDSVPISQAYRAVVFHPSNSQVYVMFWVDHHDEAYR